MYDKKRKYPQGGSVGSAVMLDNTPAVTSYCGVLAVAANPAGKKG